MPKPGSERCGRAAAGDFSGAHAARARRRAAYDYVLVVGPGRSGSEFLYRNLRAHPDLALPEIKESYYYRSLADFRRAWRLKDADGKILVDVGNLAYMDAALVPGVARLRRDGYRVLLVVLLRDHRARALSMMRFRRSRGERSAWRGRRGLEEAVVRDRLTPRQLQAMFRLDVDVLTIHFPALIDRPAEILDVLAARCRIARFAEVRRDVANESEDARYFWLAALGKMGAGVLRRLGFRRTWQRLNPGDNRFTRRLFFVPRAANRNDLSLSGSAAQCLETAGRECRSFIEARSVRVADGVYLRTAADPQNRAGPGPSAPRSSRA